MAQTDTALVHSDAALVCSATGRPAYAELRLGQGAAWSGSRHDGSLFVAVSPDVHDGAYSDDQLDRLLSGGHVVLYGTLDEGLLPAGEIGLAAATELFIIGAGQIEEAIESGESISKAANPITACLVGRPARGQGPDITSLGRLWALTEYARGVRPLVDLDPKEVAAQVFADLVKAERPGAGAEAPGLRRLH